MKAYGAYSKNSEIKKLSSSGGIFYELALCFIKNGGVVYGAFLADDLTLAHIKVENICDLTKILGSKYVQSDISKALSDMKNEKRAMLFCGAPCQIAAVNAQAKKCGYTEQVTTIDFACHGTPINKIFFEYINDLEEQYNSKVIEYSFRSKRGGWSKLEVYCKFENGREYFGKGEEDAFRIAFARNYCLKESCYSCKYANLNRVSDLTLCDYWGVANLQKELYNEEGVSLVLCNTSNGQGLFDELDIVKKEADITAASKVNLCLMRPSTKPENAEAFMRDLKEKGFKFVKKKYLTPDPKLKVIFKKIMRKFR